ncbi:FAD/FMN-containing dehydrogenase [Isoptericola sp. CG 20/1183]|uniref:FAD/FMN-containing dehydrogenase n=1 Tax=Isoptericola halotolerans TaxID=300560 RepID=A0ABX5EAW9_9MICO|nr:MULTISPECIES: FAD-binding protein [Isoptericola]PRZ04417.1 FAD/FMN-containing dehydrogenase [Isoptericola halotolerans]PRZ04685.1 FAD/FMN-containing dehydrogenase [Isoptericola sp. CG 20/1183]
MTSIPPPSALRAALDGTATVLTPGADAFEAAHQIRLGGVDAVPVAVVRPTDTTGVARTVRLAAEHGLELAVRSGGHSALGRGRQHGALVLDVRGLDTIRIDRGAGTATAGGGITAGAYTAATAEHGLVTPFGDTGTVGVAGITLGGGVGFLSRRLGMTIDSLRAAQVVTADGKVRLASPDSYPDLFWGIRGGGGNLGVVTELTFDVHELGTVVGGPLILPGTPASVAGAVSLLRAAPRELAAIVMVMVAPPMPFLPAEVHGRLITMVNLCWSGDVDEAEAAVAPLRALGDQEGGVLADLVAPGPYPGLLVGPEGPPLAMRYRSFFADDLDEASAAELLAALESSTATMRAVQLRVLGGAVADVPADATAFVHRDAAITGVVAAAEGTSAAVAEHAGWATALADRLRAGRPGAYVNFVPDGDPALLADAYPGATGRRLAALKGTYDPHNLFRGNLNVEPVQAP